MTSESSDSGKNDENLSLFLFLHVDFSVFLPLSLRSAIKTKKRQLAPLEIGQMAHLEVPEKSFFHLFVFISFFLGGIN